MAQLGIKVEPSIKQAFIDLGFELDLTQSELVERLLQVHEQLGVPVNNDGALKDLQDTVESQKLAMSKLESKNTDLANDNAALQGKITEQQVFIDEQVSRISGLANDNKALQDILAISEKKVQELAKPSDLTADVHELSMLSKLSKAVHLYVQQRARVTLRSAKNITEQQAIKLFIDSYNE